MNKFIFTLKKTTFRLGRLFYVLSKSNIRKWVSIFSKSNRNVLLDAVILRHAKNDKYQQEIEFLKTCKNIVAFPYPAAEIRENVVSGYDKTKKMPYVIHKNRTLYFPESWQDKMIEIYNGFLYKERILEKTYSGKSPHQYQTNSFHVEKDDILIDTGCAEALFTLDVIDIVKKAFLFEFDELWFKPLEATFEEELKSGKVVLIKKYAGKENTANTATILSVIEHEDFESVFIKMDIEGYESEVVTACESWMQADKKIKFSCCTYHKAQDAAELKSFFEKNGYNTEFSNGYMLFHDDKLIKYPYFRHGIIHATNKKNRILNNENWI